MDIQERIHDFWSSRAMQYYQIDNIFSVGIYNEDISILHSLGLPIIETNYHKFFPVKKLINIEVDGEKFVVLGSPFDKELVELDNLVVMNTSNNQVYLLSISFFEIGFVPSQISLINTSITNFLYFNMEFLKIIEEIFISKNLQSFYDIERRLIATLNKLHLNDKIGLGLHDDHRLFWRKRFYTLFSEIEVEIGEFIIMENIMLKLTQK